jgi:hypothetical protein
MVFLKKVPFSDRVTHHPAPGQNGQWRTLQPFVGRVTGLSIT